MQSFIKKTIIHILTLCENFIQILYIKLSYIDYINLFFNLKKPLISTEITLWGTMAPATNKLSHCTVQCLGWWFTPPMIQQMIQGRIEHKTFSLKNCHYKRWGPDQGLFIITMAVYLARPAFPRVPIHGLWFWARAHGIVQISHR